MAAPFTQINPKFCRMETRWIRKAKVWKTHACWLLLKLFLWHIRSLRAETFYFIIPTTVLGQIDYRHNRCQHCINNSILLSCEFSVFVQVLQRGWLLNRSIIQARNLYPVLRMDITLQFVNLYHEKFRNTSSWSFLFSQNLSSVWGNSIFI